MVVRRFLPYALLALWALLADAWFGGPLFGTHHPWTAVLLAVALVAGAAALAWTRRAALAGVDRRLVGAVAALLALATIVRLPALLAPYSVISGDSAVNGIVAHEIRIGALAPPVYAPGYPYEGTLKVNATALAGRALPSVGTPWLYVWIGHAFYLLWAAAVIVLAHRIGGLRAAIGAGLFMALSPRFLTAFSVNNVGQYQELNAFGALALAAIASGGGLGLAAFLVGLAVWQQLVAFYFVLVLLVAVLLTPDLRRPRALLDGAAGFAAGTFPIWIWNASNHWATFDFFRRGAKGGATGRLSELPAQLGRTLRISFPKLFGASDLDLPTAIAVTAALALPAIVLAMAWTLRRDIAAQRGRSAAFLVALLFAVTLSVFATSKFSRRGIQRPRYLLPLYTPVAAGVGWGLAALSARSRPAGLAAGALVLGWNALSTVPWLNGRRHAHAADAAFLDTLEAAGVRRGHAGFTLATRYTFLSEGRTLIAGDLGPEVDWVYLPHAHEIEEEGADAYFTDRSDLADRLGRRLNALGVTFERTAGLPAMFHRLSRRVALTELDGYDAGAESAAEGEAAE
jgi:hypothetical protein